jgi:hypothetical protein
MTASRTLVLRVWMPDRPGALGQVASRIGAVHGDVTAIDILERGAGRVIDELVVSLPEPTSIDLLASEIRAVDGVAVEHIRPIDDDRLDSGTAFLELAAQVAAAAPGARLAVLGDGLRSAADADWAVVLRHGVLAHCAGTPPDPGWLLAFLDGSGHLDTSRPAGPEDVVWAHLPRSGFAIAAGRADRAVHARERSRTAFLAQVLDALLVGSAVGPAA